MIRLMSVVLTLPLILLNTAGCQSNPLPNPLLGQWEAESFRPVRFGEEVQSTTLFVDEDNTLTLNAIPKDDEDTMVLTGTWTQATANRFDGYLNDQDETAPTQVRLLASGKLQLTLLPENESEPLLITFRRAEKE